MPEILQSSPKAINERPLPKARKSTGTRAAAGKFRSSLNFLRHGTYAKTFTLKTEDQARFQSVIDDYVANFAPQSYAELEFVEQMATASWRRHRIATHQPSTYRLESAERLAAASFRAALRGLQNFRAFLEEQKQL